jgi:single-strand DNA-binding protein
MASYNKVILMGNLTRDPELRYTGSGTAVCGLGLAVNRTYKTQSGELKEDPCFIDVTAWGKQAESCNSYLKKGAPVFVEGTLRLESWTDKTSGQNRSKHTISAESVRFLGAPQSGSGGFSDNPQTYQKQASAPAPAQPQYQQPVQQQAPAQYSAPNQSAPQSAPAPQAQAPVASQAPQPQAAPQATPPSAPSQSFQPPPMPEFNTELEDDIPF